jgi:hypothetical protein
MPHRRNEPHLGRQKGELWGENQASLEETALAMDSESIQKLSVYTLGGRTRVYQGGWQAESHVVEQRLSD